MGEVHDIGDNGSRYAGAQTQLIVGRRVDDHMTDGRQMRRKGHVEVFPDGIDHELLPFPKKIMVVRNRRH